MIYVRESYRKSICVIACFTNESIERFLRLAQWVFTAGSIDLNQMTILIIHKQINQFFILFFNNSYFTSNTLMQYVSIALL